MIRRRTLWLLTVTLILAASLVLALTRTSENNQQVASFTLRDLLSSEDCERACWHGIEPGVTTKEQVQAILENTGTDFEEKSLPEPDKNSVYDLHFPDETDAIGAIAISDNLVSQITLPIDACISRVVDVYGVPAEVQEDGIYITLLYPDSGLIFNVNVEDQTRVASVFLTSPSIFARRSGDSLEHNWDEFKDRFAGECEDSIAPLGVG